jgi:hypothetical protein
MNKNFASEIVQILDKELGGIEQMMRNCIKLAKESYLQGNKYNACILVDPSQNNLILLESID